MQSGARRERYIREREMKDPRSPREVHEKSNTASWAESVIGYMQRRYDQSLTACRTSSEAEAEEAGTT